MINKYPEPVEEMEEVIVDIPNIKSEKVNIRFPEVVMILESQYRDLTEKGISGILCDGVYEALEKENNPDRILSFALWQMEKLRWDEAENLLEYITGKLKDMPEYRNREKWTEFLTRLTEYTDQKKKEYYSRPVIERVFPGEGYRVYCLCRDGKFRIFDMRPMLNPPKGAFEVLTDPAFFRDHIAVINDTLAWDRTGEGDPNDCINIDSHLIYAEGKVLEMDEIIRIVDHEKRNNGQS